MTGVTPSSSGCNRGQLGSDQHNSRGFLELDRLGSDHGNYLIFKRKGVKSDVDRCVLLS